MNSLSARSTLQWPGPRAKALTTLLCCFLPGPLCRGSSHVSSCSHVTDYGQNLYVLTSTLANMKAGRFCSFQWEQHVNHVKPHRMATTVCISNGRCCFVWATLFSCGDYAALSEELIWSWSNVWFLGKVEERMLFGLVWPGGKANLHCRGLTCFIRFWE